MIWLVISLLLFGPVLTCLALFACGYLLSKYRNERRQHKEALRLALESKGHYGAMEVLAKKYFRMYTQEIEKQPEQVESKWGPLDEKYKKVLAVKSDDDDWPDLIS